MGFLPKPLRSCRLPGLALAAAALILAFQAGPAEANFNESRWFLQNVCLAKANKYLGNSDWAKYQKEANRSRARLRSKGVPEHHLREMERMTTRMITVGVKRDAPNSPRLCIQWYNT